MASVAVMATVIVIKDILGNTVPTARYNNDLPRLY
jgi:hypothetical protein